MTQRFKLHFHLSLWCIVNHRGCYAWDSIILRYCSAARTRVAAGRWIMRTLRHVSRPRILHSDVATEDIIVALLFIDLSWDCCSCHNVNYIFSSWIKFACLRVCVFYFTDQIKLHATKGKRKGKKDAMKPSKERYYECHDVGTFFTLFRVTES